MPGFNPDFPNKVRSAIKENPHIPLTEPVCRFLVGYTIDNKRTHIGFKVQKIGSTLRYMPDIDVLEMNDSGEAIGYEIKGVQDGRVGKSQLYEGLGQAQLLLADPAVLQNDFFDTPPTLRKSYLAYPAHKLDESSEEWIGNFNQRVKEIPHVGLVTVDRQDGMNVEVEPEPNALSPQEVSGLDGYARKAALNLRGDEIRELLREHCDDLQNPVESLVIQAKEIAEEHNIDILTS